MHHRLSGLSTYGLNGHRKGDEHSAGVPLPLVVYGSVYFVFF